MSDKSGNLRDLISLWTLRGRLEGQREVDWLCLKQTPSPGDGPVACAVLLPLQDAFSLLCWASVWMLIKLLGAHAQSWTSHFPDAGPACVALRWPGSLLSLPRGLEPILQTQAAGLFVSETGLGSERLIFWDGPKRGSAQQVPRGTEIS